MKSIVIYYSYGGNTRNGKDIFEQYGFFRKWMQVIR